MDFNSVPAILLYEEGEVTDFHLDVTVFDRCRGEVKPGLLQVAISWISRIDSHLSASQSSEIQSGIIDALRRCDAAVEMLPHLENVAAKGQSPTLCFLGQRETETEGDFMRLMFCNVGQGDRGPFSSSAASVKSRSGVLCSTNSSLKLPFYKHQTIIL